MGRSGFRPLLFSRCFLALIRIEQRFADTDIFRRHFDHFVIVDIGDCLFQRHHLGWCQADASSLPVEPKLVSCFDFIGLKSSGSGAFPPMIMPSYNASPGETNSFPMGRERKRRHCRLKSARRLRPSRADDRGRSPKQAVHDALFRVCRTGIRHDNQSSHAKVLKVDVRLAAA